MATTTPSSLPSSVSPLRFRQALEQAQPAMAALADSELLDVNVDIPSAVVAILGYGESESLKELRPRIAEELPKFPIEQFDKLVTWALAAGQAHTDLLATSKSPDYQDTVVALEEARDLMKADIGVLAKRNLVDGSRLSELRGPTGHKNLAFDVLLCCTILRAHWPTIQGRTAITLEEIERAEHLADRLAMAVGARAQAGPSTAAEARTRAFTLMANAHDEVRRAVAYLRWKQGDVDRILPSLYANRGPGRRKSNGPGEELPVEGGSVATPAPAGSNGNGAPTPSTGAPSGTAAAPSATPAASAAKPPSASGLPDEDPFARG